MEPHKVQLLNVLLEASNSRKVEWQQSSLKGAFTTLFTNVRVEIIPPEGYNSALGSVFSNGWRLIVYDNKGSMIMEINDRVAMPNTPFAVDRLRKIYASAINSFSNREVEAVNSIMRDINKR